MLVYKITDALSWRNAVATGHFEGSADDLRDGFVHLSASEQTRDTLARHFAGRDDLVVVAVDTERLGPALKWEISRGGAKFPHHYGPLPTSACVWWRPLPLEENGAHRLPPEMPPEII